MSTRDELLAEIRDNLDDLNSSDYRWSNDRLERIMRRRRMKLFQQIRRYCPDLWFRDYEDSTLVADQSEYDLQPGVKSVLGVELLTDTSGVALDFPMPLSKIEYIDRDKYAGRGPYFDDQTPRWYYLIESVDGTTMGLLPTPVSGGAEVRTWELGLMEASEWEAGLAGDDATDSGLPEDWESLFVIQCTIDALRQRPPKENRTLELFLADEKQTMQAIVEDLGNREVDASSPRQVREDNPQPEL